MAEDSSPEAATLVQESLARAVARAIERTASRWGRLRAGQSVQLHRWGKLDRLAPAYRPTDRTHSLYELRGDDLVPVPTQAARSPQPREWSV